MLILLLNIVTIAMLLVATYFLLEVASYIYTNSVLKVPYVPNSYEHINFALDLVKLSESDILYDLGSGDGRVLQIALQSYNVKKAVGYEGDGFQNLKAKLRLKFAKLDPAKYVLHRANFFNLPHNDWTEATVLYLYLFPEVLAKIGKVLQKTPEKYAGLRIVSCRYQIKGLKPVKIAKKDGFEFYVYKIG